MSNPATALNMLPAIGARVIVRFESISVNCTVKDVKNSWGKPRLLIQPDAGVGTQWVEMDRLRVSQTEQPLGLANAYARREHRSA